MISTSLVSLMACVAMAMLALFPPQLGVRESWIGVALLALAALIKIPFKQKLDVLLLFLGLIPIFGTVASGAFDGLGSISWLALGLLVFRLGGALFSRAEERWKLVLGLSLILVFEAWLSIGQIRLDSSLLIDSAAGGIIKSRRVWGSFATPNLLAAWTIMIFPLTLDFYSSANSFFRRAASVLVSLVALTVLWETRSGGGAMALALAAVLTAALLKRRRSGFLVLAFSVAALVAAVIASRGFTWLNPASGNDILFNRLILWIPAWDAWLKAPWLGHGPAGGIFAYHASQLAMHSGYGDHPHQLILSILLEWGIFGLAFAFAAALFLSLRIRRQFRVERAGLFIGVMAPVIHAQGELSFQQPAILFPWILLLGALCGSGEAAKEELDPLVFQQGRSWHAEALVVAMLFLSAWRGGLMAWQWPWMGLGIGVLAWMSPGPSLGFSGLVLGGVLAAIGAGFWSSLNPAVTLECISAAVLAAMAIRTIGSQSRRGWEIWISLLSLLFVSIFFAAGAQGVSRHLFNRELPDLHYFFPNQNLLAGSLLVPCFLLALGRIIEDGGIFGWWLAAGASLTGIFLSGSRGACLALAVGFAWFFYRVLAARKSRAYAAMALMTLFLTAMLLAPGSRLNQRLRFQRQAGGADPYFNFRSEIWKESLKASLERWGRGWGIGSYQRVMELRPLALPSGAERLGLEHAHNSWLELAVEAGWPVAIILFLMFGRRLLRWRFDDALGGRAAAEAALIGMVVHSAVDFEYSTPFSIMIAICIFTIRQQRSQQGVYLGFSWKWLVFLLGSILIAGGTGAFLEKKLSQEYISCDCPGFRRAESLRPYDTDIAIRQSLLDASCFDSGKDSRGLSRAIRELCMSVDIDPANRKIHSALILLLSRARISLSNENINSLGDFLPGWFDLALDHPQEDAISRLSRIIENERLLESNVQMK